MRDSRDCRGADVRGSRDCDSRDGRDCLDRDSRDGRDCDVCCELTDEDVCCEAGGVRGSCDCELADGEAPREADGEMLWEAAIIASGLSEAIRVTPSCVPGCLEPATIAKRRYCEAACARSSLLGPHTMHTSRGLSKREACSSTTPRLDLLDTRVASWPRSINWLVSALLPTTTNLLMTATSPLVLYGLTGWWRTVAQYQQE